jgi:hypothetical protein
MKIAKVKKSEVKKSRKIFREWFRRVNLKEIKN